MRCGRPRTCRRLLKSFFFNHAHVNAYASLSSRMGGTGSGPPSLFRPQRLLVIYGVRFTNLSPPLASHAHRKIGIGDGGPRRLSGRLLQPRADQGSEQRLYGDLRGVVRHRMWVRLEAACSFLKFHLASHFPCPWSYVIHDNALRLFPTSSPQSIGLLGASQEAPAARARSTASPRPASFSTAPGR